FCGTGCITGCDEVNEPSCSGSSSDTRIIGYYSSSAYTRTCNSWSPENIDPGLWTHLIYAFALIGSDYRIAQGNSFDTELYPRFTGLKQSRAGLNTLISVGGWDAGGTIFSDMVSTSATRSTFINSVISFMASYGFDGIDLDWEYPAASDRGGLAADTENYVALVKELKAACGNRYTVTVTLPSSYWYLQGFDVSGMEPYVDWFHFMSYDIHGTWDGNSPYTKSVVQPHTNLTEIKEGLDLLWRNEIDPQKVVLGEAFYGRSFTLSDTSCTAPGCPFSSGGDPGQCTATSGILSDAEIQGVISEHGLTPTFDEAAGIKYIVWNENQWVSYDDSETLDLKRTFANEKCLGGRMVWSVDMDDNTSKQASVNLNAAGLELIGDDVSANPAFAVRKLSATSSQNAVNLVSYWTDCAAEPQCNAGFTLWTTGHGKVYDADKGVYTGDGCHGGGKGFNRGLCVESDVQAVNCQWYGKAKG
ncbi:putative class V chitinase, partial [Aspergillus fijiensis CBS 313.89]